jgi:hypothetical protein
MNTNLPLVQNLKIKCNLNELQVLHFLQNYGYIINEQKIVITATSKNLESFINISCWWADFIAACNKINTAYRQANTKKTNASIVLNYSEAAALYKVITRINWEQEDTYAQIVIYGVVEKLNRYLC